ncbi:hypothetical protein [Mycolicibacterium pulveris]|uniref:hypothetical protein n=1 Tax=Mycolicibacterium pulveris TaxID=36813 RepID=UPI003CF25170
MSRRDSRARAEEAFALRAIGRTWAEVSAELGYRSRGAAQLAVARLHARQPATSPETVRRSSTESLRIMRSILFERFAAAKQAGDDQTLIGLHRELTRNLSEAAKLHGAHAPEKLDVDVTVRQSPSEILAEAQERVLAIIDAEIEDERKELG